MFECFDEDAPIIDLLTLSYIIDDNVDKVVFTSDINPKVLPKRKEHTTYYKALTSFTSFLEFYENLIEAGEHSEIIMYYKLKFDACSLASLYSKYIRIKNENIEEEEEAGYYNKEINKILIDCNDYVANSSDDNLYKAPLYLSKYLEKNNEKEKARRLRNEAKRIAVIYDKLVEYKKEVSKKEL